MNLTELLISARGYVERGWTQDVGARNALGAECDPCDARAASWCTAGAVYAAGGGVTSLVFLARELMGLGMMEVERDSLSNWNDDPARTKAEVLALFDRAIERSKEDPALRATYERSKDV